MIILYSYHLYRLGIIKQVRNVGTSVIRTFHLSMQYDNNQPVDKGVQIIKVAL